MAKLYPIVKYAKTCLGRKLSENELGMKMYYCPKCNRRLHQERVDPNTYMNDLCRRMGRPKELKPIYCQQCGNLIHPLPTTQN